MRSAEKPSSDIGKNSVKCDNCSWQAEFFHVITDEVFRLDLPGRSLYCARCIRCDENTGILYGFRDITFEEYITGKVMES